jgi:hypothetical protein
VATSSFTTLKTGLLTLLSARAGLSGVQVSYAWPGDSQEQESIWLSEVRGTLAWASFGSPTRKPRFERYSLDVVIVVQGYESTPATVELRARALMGEIEDALADDVRAGLSATLPTLGIQPVSYDVSTMPLDPAGWGTQIKLVLEADSHLA